MPSPSSPISDPQVKKILSILDERKGEHLVVYDVRKAVSFTDHVVLATASSDAHAKALVKYVTEGLAEDGILPFHKAKRNDIGNWVVIDYSDVVVHIFRAETRARYNLEELYKDCPQTAI